MNRIIVLIILVTGIFFIGLKSNIFAHGGAKHLEQETAIVTYSDHIKPIFAEKCSSCHGDGSPEHHEFEKNMKKYISEDKGHT